MIEDTLDIQTRPLPDVHDIAAGNDVWIVNVGPGDTFETATVYSWGTL